jgi:hypothetical protein
MITVDQVMAQLKRASVFMYVVSLNMHIDTKGKDTRFTASATGRITLDHRALANDPDVVTEEYNVKSFTMAAAAFIFGHEVAHVILGHTTHHDEPSVLVAQREDAYAFWLSCETHCNWFTAQQLGYKFPDVVQVHNPAKPTWTFVDKLKYGFDATGMHWKEIYDKIKNHPAHRGMQAPDSDVIQPGDEHAPYLGPHKDGNADYQHTVLTEEDINAIVQRAASAAGSAPSAMLMRMEIKEKEVLPWEALVRRMHASVKTTGRTWSKPSRTGLPIRGIRDLDTQYKILCYVDTSGSVPVSEVQRFVSALYAGAPSISVDVLSFDTQVMGVSVNGKATRDSKGMPTPIKATDLHKSPVGGGGGTSFHVVASDWNRRKGYDIAICITDGEAQLPSSKLYKFIWLIHGYMRGKFKAPEQVFSYNPK